MTLHSEILIDNSEVAVKNGHSLVQPQRKGNCFEALVKEANPATARAGEFPNNEIGGYKQSHSLSFSMNATPSPK